MPRWISPEAAAEGFVDGCSVTGSDDAGDAGSVTSSEDAGAGGSVAGSDDAGAGGFVAGSDDAGAGGSVAGSDGTETGGSVTGSDGTGDADSAVGSEDAGADGPACGSDAVEAAASAAGSDGAVLESPTAAFFDAETAGSVAEVPDSMEAVSAACTFRFSQPFMGFPSAPCISRTASIAASTFLPLRFFIFSIVLSCPSDICNPLHYLPDSVKIPPSIS